MDGSQLRRSDDVAVAEAGLLLRAARLLHTGQHALTNPRDATQTTTAHNYTNNCTNNYTHHYTLQQQALLQYGFLLPDQPPLMALADQPDYPDLVARGEHTHASPRAPFDGTPCKKRGGWLACLRGWQIAELISAPPRSALLRALPHGHPPPHHHPPHSSQVTSPRSRPSWRASPAPSARSRARRPPPRRRPSRRATPAAA